MQEQTKIEDEETRTGISATKSITEADAIFICAQALKKQAQYDFKWTAMDAATSSRSNEILVAMGVKYENGFGTWENYKGTCTLPKQATRKQIREADLGIVQEIDVYKRGIS
jgi:hypothetical protein